MRDWLATLHEELLRSGAAMVRVVVAATRGSAPRDSGACMLVSRDREWGTIGGGHLEHVATRTARDMLARGDSPRLDRFSLGASLGQCCGGIVELWFQRYEAADIPFLARALRARAQGAATVMVTSLAASGEAPRLIDEPAVTSAKLVRHPQGAELHECIASAETDLWLFGAGHVGRALVNVLAELPFRLTWIDSREGMLPERLPENARAVYSPDPAEEVKDMARGAWALVMTHSHDEDLAICEALLADARFGWAGVIGSAPKAARFRQRLERRGFTREAIARLAMPIGIGGIRSKEPAAIAVAAAAQLLQLREAIPAGAEVSRERDASAARGP